MTSNPGTAQRHAFSYLRDRARRAHLDGDGLRVNSLCALALVHLQDLASRHELQISVQELRWAFIFPMFWLIDEYMLSAVGDGLGGFVKGGLATGEIYQILRAYHYLLEPPLEEIDEQMKFLEGITLDWLSADCEVEDAILLTHIVELLWYRRPRESFWRSLGESWASRCPATLRKTIEDRLKRLDIQSRLTCPDGKQGRIERGAIQTSLAAFPYAKLWAYLLYCDGVGLDQTIIQLNGRTAPESYAARLLFDFHHANRFSGNFGEPQILGLTRRRLFNESSPILTFTEVREAHLSETLGRLYRSDKVGQASTRLHAFRLAMLCEVAALELWDWAAWRVSILAQAETHLELCKWETCRPEVPAHAIRLLVQCVRYKPKHEDRLVSNAFNQLEFAPKTVLADLVEKLLNAYPEQMHGAYEALDDLRDLIPEEMWPTAAEWSVDYADQLRKGLRFGPSVPLQFWEQILPFVPEASGVWDLLLPEMLTLATNSLVWLSGGEKLFGEWLMHAPAPKAKAVGEESLEMKTDWPIVVSRRRCVLLNAEKKRSWGLGVFSRKLICTAQSDVERLDFIRFVSESEADKIRTAAKPIVVQALRTFIAQATPPADTKQFCFGSMPNGPLFDIRWDENDLPLVKDLISAVDNPQVLAHSLLYLLTCLQSFVVVGPLSFAEVTFERAAVWLVSPPQGREVHSSASGPFSIVQVNDETLSMIPQALAGLSLQLSEKLGERADPAIIRWLQHSVLDPRPTAIPIMFELGVRIALRIDGPVQGDLLATCQNMLLELWSHRNDDKRAEPRLAQAIRYLGRFLRGDISSRPAWKPGTGEKAVQQLVAKLPKLLGHFCRSSNADVRAAVAALLRSLKRWHTLCEPLERILADLGRDRRGRVRFAAGAEGRDASPEGAGCEEGPK